MSTFVKFPPTSLPEAIDVIDQDAEILHEVVHGDDTTEVLTENGLIPSIAKWQKDNTIGITEHDQLTNRNIPDQHNISAITGLQTALDGKANTSHTHVISNITGLQTALDGKVSVVSGKQLSTEDYTTAEKNKLNGIQTSAQNNTASNVGASGAGLYKEKVGSDLRFKKIIATGAASLTEQADTITINVTGGGGGEIPTSHNELTGRDATDCHPIGAITNLQTTLDGKAATTHTHVISDVTGLQTALDGKAATVHTHTIDQVTGLQTALDGKEALGTAATIQNNNKLIETIKSKATYIADFVRNEFKVWESPYGQQPKQITDVLTTTRNSDGTVNTPFGVQTRAANIARIEFDPLTGEPLGLLCEEQRTNLGLWSEDLTQLAWNKAGLTAPSPTVMQEDTSNTQHRLSQNFNITEGSTYTYSVNASPLERSVLQIVPSGAVFPLGYANFDLINGVVSAQSGLIAKIKKRVDGSFDCYVTITAISSGTSGPFNLVMQNSPTASRFGAYIGDGVSRIKINRQMCEASSYPTSYIPTGASAVTRVQDTNTRSLEGIYNPNHGTLYWEGFINDDTDVRGILSVGATNADTNRCFGLIQRATGFVQIFFFSAGGNTNPTAITTSNLFGFNRIAFTYNFTTLKAFASINGSTPVEIDIVAAPVGINSTDNTIIFGRYRRLLDPQQNQICSGFEYLPVDISPAELVARTSGV